MKNERKKEIENVNPLHTGSGGFLTQRDKARQQITDQQEQKCQHFNLQASWRNNTQEETTKKL